MLVACYPKLLSAIFIKFLPARGAQCRLDFLSKRFPEVPPAKGGNEKTWIQQYVDARHDWLATHPRKVLQNIVYRTQCFKWEVAWDNRDLSQVPINADGVDVFGQ